MAGICCGVVGESETSAAIKRTTKRRKPEIRQINFVAEAAVKPSENDGKRQKLEVYHRSAFPRKEKCAEGSEVKAKARERDFDLKQQSLNTKREVNKSMEVVVQEENPKFGMTSVCGRRRDMEDSVAIHPSFCRQSRRSRRDSHFFGVYDGHGCSHVAMKCKAGLHQIVKEELEIGGGGGEGEGEGEVNWKEAMSRSFSRMDKEVHEWSNSNSGLISNCRCELQTPQCDAVGSTAVVAVVTPNKIVVSNCGDSRAVLCRGGVAIPLSSDHKPDRPDELKRIETAGGRVIYWDGARVLGVLAMSRAIGDNYLKPYVISEPEVTVNDRTAEDEFIILASDGLWDVVTNETACGVVRMCLNLAATPAVTVAGGPCFDGGESSDKACLDASILLTKLALARQSSDNVSVVVIDLRRDV